MKYYFLSKMAAETLILNNVTDTTSEKRRRSQHIRE
ncbi:hypothetical protein SAMN06298226_1109 [Nitrosovibrio sp. Nv4]|nr:hypothetical protein SAMN06298226_1109 [Nitrosovibrio sp. Nv4]